MVDLESILRTLETRQEDALGGMAVHHRALCTNMDSIAKGNAVTDLSDNAVLHLERQVLFKIVSSSL